MFDTVKGDMTVLREPGGQKRAWAGWRPFVIEARQRESAFVTSFVLRPIDGAALLHRPGQHLTLRLDVPGLPGLKRSYSISSGPEWCEVRKRTAWSLRAVPPSRFSSTRSTM